MNKLTILMLTVLFLAGCGSGGFSIIDVHEHIESPEKAIELREVMQELGIEKTVLLPSPNETITLNGQKSFTKYRENMQEILKISHIFPNEFIPLCTISPLDDDALQVFRDCVKQGGKGLKLYNGHSLYYDIFGMPLDAAPMQPIYAYAEREGLPVLFHVNINKYWEELENVLRTYPDLVVLVPHFMVSSANLWKAEGLFNRYPNLLTDISFGYEEFMAAGFRRISANPKLYTDFISRYPDRILFGADLVLTEVEQKDADYMRSMLQCYRDLLEKKRFQCEPARGYYADQVKTYEFQYQNCEPKSGRYCLEKKARLDEYKKWHKETAVFNGLALDKPALQKIYRENPRRFLGL